MKRLVITSAVLATILGFGAQRGAALSFVRRRQPVRDGNTGREPGGKGT
jgi:hypothetical protein